MGHHECWLPVGRPRPPGCASRWVLTVTGRSLLPPPAWRFLRVRIPARPLARQWRHPGHYRIPNLQIDGYDVVTNTPWASSYRALGATNSAFASESVVDELCEKLGMDPIEFRLLNGVREGDPRGEGSTFARIGFLETLETARGHPHYTAPLNGPHQGRGIAAGYWATRAGGQAPLPALTRMARSA